jgi:RecA-family ATPase
LSTDLFASATRHHGDTAPVAVTWGEMETTEYETDVPVVTGVPRGGLGMVSARTNVGKSTLLRNLALSVAAGIPFLNLVRGGDPLRVLLLDFETPSTSMLKADIRRMTGNLPPAAAALVRRNLMISHHVEVEGMPLRLSEREHFDRFSAYVREQGVDLVIVDTVTSAFFLKDENSNAEVKWSVMMPLSQLARDTNSALVYAHHIGKRGEGGDDRSAYASRGASVFSDYPPTVFNLTDASSHGDEKRVRLTCAKIKGEGFDEVELKEDREIRWFRPVGDFQRERTSLEVLVEVVEEFYRLYESDMPTAKIIEAMEERTLIKERAVMNLLSVAAKTGLINKARHGHYRPRDKKLHSRPTARRAA